MSAPRLTTKELRAALPQLDGSLRLPGLEGPVDVWRDRWGIPHIRAASVHDAFLTQGFVHAQDRLWAMDADRRRGAGRWAAVVGPGGVEQDTLMRRFGLEASARQDYQRGVNAETRAMLDGYTAGVNAFIAHATSSGRIPVEYRLLGESPAPWQPWDCLLVFKVRHVMMGVWEGKVWRARLVNQLGPEVVAKLLPGYASGQPLILPPGAAYEGSPLDGLAELRRGAPIVGAVPALRHEPGGGDDEDGGSNSWALAGRRTATGKPLVAGDPHRALDVPNVYYQNHLACPDFDVVGLSIAGVPGFPHFGHNASVAWCITHAGADYQDLFVEQFDPVDPDRYRWLDGWKTAERRRETIQVRGAAAVEIDVVVTHHGPIVLGDPAEGHALAFRYTATARPNAGFDALPTMLRARSVSELEEAMRPWVDPANNFLMADTEGTIAYRTRGEIPARTIANGWLPVPGWTGEHEWQGAVPFEEMPTMRDPRAGIFVTANNRIVGEGHPHYLALEFAPGFRAQRILERLGASDRLTADEVTAIHADRVSIPAGALARLVAAVDPTDEWTAWARDALLAWDGVMAGDGVAPLIYATFAEQLLCDVMAPILGPLAAMAMSGTGRGGPAHMSRLRVRLPDLIAADDRSFLPEGTEWPEVMRAALTRAVETLRARLGDDRSEWRWDRLHRTRPVHPLSPVFPNAAPLLDPPSVGMGGDGETVAAARFVGGGDFTIATTSVARYLFDLSDWDRSGWVVPLGASGHPGSPHYADQIVPWSQYHLLPMLYDWERVREEAESHQLLT